MILAGAELGCLDRHSGARRSAQRSKTRASGRAGSSRRPIERTRRFRDERSDFVGPAQAVGVRARAGRALELAAPASVQGKLSLVRARARVARGASAARDVVRDLRLVPQPGRGKQSQAARRAAKQRTRPCTWRCSAGCLSRVGQWMPEHRVYFGARQTRFALHPSSGLAKKPPAWVMAFELVETSQLFARTAAKIEPALARSRGRAPAQTQLFGAALVGKVRARLGARARDAVRPAGAARSQRRLRDDCARPRAPDVPRARARARRIPEPRRVSGAKPSCSWPKSRGCATRRERATCSPTTRRCSSFFDRRVPADVVNGKTFEAWRERAEASDPKLLVLDFADVLGEDQTLSPELYPDSIRAARRRARRELPIRAGRRGRRRVARICRSRSCRSSTNGELDGTIPAWREQKIAALLEELPRALRRELGDTKARKSSRLSSLVASKPLEGPCWSCSRAVCSSSAARTSSRVNFGPTPSLAICNFTFGSSANEAKCSAKAATSADLLRTLRTPGPRRPPHAPRCPRVFSSSGITTWNFDELPKQVTHRVHGSDVPVFPALVDQGSAAGIQLFETSEAAERAHLGGVRRLLRIACKSTLSSLEKRMPPPLSHRHGLPPSRAEQAAFAETVRARVTAEAFVVAPGAELPRTRADFQRLLAAGTPRLFPTFDTLLKLLAAVRAELDKTAARPRRRPLAARRHPGERRRSPAARAARPCRSPAAYRPRASLPTPPLPRSRSHATHARHPRPAQRREQSRTARARAPRFRRQVPRCDGPRSRAPDPLLARGAPGRHLRPRATPAHAAVDLGSCSSRCGAHVARQAKSLKSACARRCRRAHRVVAERESSEIAREKDRDARRRSSRARARLRRCETGF